MRVGGDGRQSLRGGAASRRQSRSCCRRRRRHRRRRRQRRRGILFQGFFIDRGHLGLKRRVIVTLGNNGRVKAVFLGKGKE